MTDELFKTLASDLVQAHNAKAINLDYWPSARELVTHYYEGEELIKPNKLTWDGESA